MSTTIDQKVVEMRFNNQQFERNAQTSLNTLEKLKRSLDLRGASKGLESLNSAAKNHNIGVLGQAAEQVGVKFSAMQVIGTTALVNLTNSAMMAGKRIVKALTIDPVKTGFQEYELKMGSVQTIMASTGESLETVNQYLSELNKYSDQTIYSFSDMTSNIGKFTNAGVKLEDAVAAIKGVSNEAAISGANANEASRAMYNFAQALSAGYVKLIDWKSIENANMATVDFKNQLIETAVSMGTVTKGADGMYKTLKGNVFSATKNFNEVLTDQWMTSEVLIATLKKYADETTDIGKKATQAATEVKTFSMMCDTLKEAAQSGWAETWEIIFGDFNKGKELWTNMSNSIGAVIDKMAKVRNTFLKGVFWEPWQLAAEYIEDAGLSAEDFKKKLMDTAGVTYKAKTYQKDFNKALKKGKITKEVVIKTLKNYTKTSKKSSENTEDMTAKLKKFQKICDEVWKGTYGNGQKRVEALTKAGYKYNEVQELVNKTQRGRKLTLDDLSESQLKSIGYTDEEIKKIKELSKEAETSGTSFNKLIENLSRPSGRELVLETVNNLLKEFSKLSEAAKKAFDKVFGGTDASGGLYNFIEHLNKLSKEFKISEKAATNFQKIFEGVFSAIQIGWNITGWGLRATIKLISAVLELFGTDLLSVITYIADLITKFNEWAQENTIWWGYINNTAKIIHALVEGIYECIKAFLGLDAVSEAFSKFWSWIGKLLNIGADFENVNSNIDGMITAITSYFSNLEEKIKEIKSFDISWKSFENFIKYIEGSILNLDKINNVFESLQEKISDFFNWIDGLKSSNNIGESIVDGIKNGIISGFHSAVEAIKQLGNVLIEAFCKLLGIHSPSKVFMAIGSNIVGGLIIGLFKKGGLVVSAIRNIGKLLITSFCNLLGIKSPSKVFIAIGAFIVLGLINGIKNTAGFLTSSVSGLVSGLFDTIGKIIQNGIPFLVDLVSTAGSKILEGFQTAQLDFTSLFVMGSFVAILLIARKFLKIMEKLSGVTSPFKALGDVFNGVTKLLGEFQKNVKANRVRIYAEAIKDISISLAILVGSFIALVHVCGKNDINTIASALIVLTTIVVAMVAMVKAADGLDAVAVGKLALFSVSFSAAMILFTIAIKRLTALDYNSAKTAVLGMIILMGALAGLFYLYGTFVKGKAAQNMDKAGIMILKLALAMGTLALVIKLIGSLEQEELDKGIKFLTGVTILFAGLIAVSKLSGKHADKAAKMIGKMGLAIMSISISMKILSTLSKVEVEKGLAVIETVMALFLSVIAVSSLAGKHAAEAGKMLWKMSLAIGVLALSIKLIGGIPTGEIVKSGIVIGLAYLMFAQFIKMSTMVGKNAGQAGKMFLGMGVSVAFLALAIRMIAGLSIEEITKGIVAIGLMFVMFGGLVKLSEFAGKHADKAGKMIFKMSLSILILSGAIALLSLIDTTKLMGATLAIATLMLCFSMMIKATEKAKNTKQMMRTLITMTAIIGVLAGIIAALSLMDSKSVLSSAIALSLLIGTLSLVTLNLKSMRSIPKKTIATMALLGVVLLELGAILAIMSLMKVEASIELCAGLVVLLGGLALVTAALQLIKTPPLMAIGAVALLGLVLAELVVVLWIMKKLDVQPSIATSGALLILLAGLTAVCYMMTGLSAVAGLAAAGIIAFGALIAELGVVLALLGKVYQDEAARKLVADGGKMLYTIGNSIGQFIGGIVSGVSEGITNFLPIIGDNLSKFWKNVSGFVSGVSGIKEDVVTGILNLSKAILILTGAELLDLVSQWVTGGSSLGAFADDLKPFGEGIRDFAKSLKGVKVESLNGVIEVVKSLVELANTIPNEGGLVSLIVGDNNIETFGDSLLGLGDNLSSFCSDMPSTESIDAAVKNIKNIVSMVNDISSAKIASLKEFKTSLSGIGASGVNAFVKAFTSETAKTNIKTAAGKLIENAVKGVKSKKSSFKTEVEKVAKSGTSAIENKKIYTSYYDAGAYVVDGFADGITGNIPKVKNAAVAMAKAAKRAAEKELDENSPSKEFFKIGDFAGLGFVNALDSYTVKAYDASARMASSAKEGFREAIDKVNSILENGVEVQPTISPVLDLSSVSSGIRSMNSMLDMGTTIGVSANVGAINSAMIGRGQNGDNEGIISAINKLRGDLGNIGGDTYVIDGVTYDDGTNISDAVKTLVRAAKVERRK